MTKLNNILRINEPSNFARSPTTQFSVAFTRESFPAGGLPLPQDKCENCGMKFAIHSLGQRAMFQSVIVQFGCKKFIGRKESK